MQLSENQERYLQPQDTPVFYETWLKPRVKANGWERNILVKVPIISPQTGISYREQEILRQARLTQESMKLLIQQFK